MTKEMQSNDQNDKIYNVMDMSNQLENALKTIQSTYVRNLKEHNGCIGKLVCYVDRSKSYEYYSYDPSKMNPKEDMYQNILKNQDIRRQNISNKKRNIEFMPKYMFPQNVPNGFNFDTFENGINFILTTIDNHNQTAHTKNMQIIPIKYIIASLYLYTGILIECALKNINVDSEYAYDYALVTLLYMSLLKHMGHICTITTMHSCLSSIHEIKYNEADITQLVKNISVFVKNTKFNYVFNYLDDDILNSITIDELKIYGKEYDMYRQPEQFANIIKTDIMNESTTPTDYDDESDNTIDDNSKRVKVE
jgi:hypothetical protein